jgi:ankyrin repeat protein
VDLVRAILHFAPHIAHRDNSQGKTALHVALEHAADIKVLKLLVEAAPESVMKNACRSTPLVVALQHNAPLPVYQLLVEANPQITKVKDEYGRYPLRCALEHRCTNPEVIRLLCSSPETVLEVDTIGRTTLHMTLDKSQLLPDICEILLDVAPEAASVKMRNSPFRHATADTLMLSLLWDTDPRPLLPVEMFRPGGMYCYKS